MTPAWALATFVFAAGIISMLLWALEAHITRRRDAPRFEPRRIAVAIEDETDDEVQAVGFPAGGEPCCCGRPDCDGTGPWPDEGIGMRASQIAIPRDGEAS